MPCFRRGSKNLASVYGSQGVKTYWDGVSLFAAPDGSSEVLATAAAGKEYEVISNDGSWVAVQMDDATVAYVPAEDVMETTILDRAVSTGDAYGDVSSYSDSTGYDDGSSYTDSSYDTSYDDGSSYTDSSYDTSYDDGSSYTDSSYDTSYDDGSSYTDSSYDTSYDDGSSLHGQQLRYRLRRRKLSTRTAATMTEVPIPTVVPITIRLMRTTPEALPQRILPQAPLLPAIESFWQA
ncbi:MAG: hypothetical protein ACLR6B_07170 [Blautia sp.]